MRRYKRNPDHMHKAVSALLGNVYRGPAMERLEMLAPDACFLFGEVRLSDFEIQAGMTDEREFIALLQVRIANALHEMAELLTAPTFPGHDEPL